MTDEPRPIEEHREAAPQSLGFAALTVSDTRTEADDRSGSLIRDAVEASDHRVEETLIVPDHPAEIRSAVQAFLGDPEIDVVVITGGSGFGPRDVTLEAVAPMFEREVPGFGELFRMLSFREVGSAAMLSRAAAGLVGARVIFCLPGSPQAVALALEKLILPEAAHLVGVASGRG